jgi:hypothetical protein
MEHCLWTACIPLESKSDDDWKDYSNDMPDLVYMSDEDHNDDDVDDDDDAKGDDAEELEDDGADAAEPGASCCRDRSVQPAAP